MPAATPAGIHTLLRRWPSLVGLAAAAVVLVGGADREAAAIVVLVAAVCYLAAAALDLPWVGDHRCRQRGRGCLRTAWRRPVVGLGNAAVALVVVGVLSRGVAPGADRADRCPARYGGLAVTALYVAPRIGAVLVALTLIAHGVWDVVHYRRDQVVPRSLAEFLCVPRRLLGVAVLIAAATGSA